MVKRGFDNRLHRLVAFANVGMRRRIAPIQKCFSNYLGARTCTEPPTLKPTREPGRVHVLQRACRLPGQLIQYTSLPQQEKMFFSAIFFKYFSTHVFCAKKRVGHAGICPLPQNGYWPASFEALPAASPKVACPAPKTCEHSLLAERLLMLSFKKKSGQPPPPKNGKGVVTPISTLANNKRSNPT